MKRNCSKNLITITVALLLSTTLNLFYRAGYAEEFHAPLSNRTAALKLPLSKLAGKNVSQMTAFTATDDKAISAAILGVSAASFGLDTKQSTIAFAETDVDEIGIRHYRGNQMIDSVPVFGSQYDIHVDTKKDSVLVAGKVTQGRPSTMEPTLDGEDALAVARTQWLSTVGTEAERMGTPELVVFDPALLDQFISGKPHLAYQIDLGSRFRSYRYFIDATTGSLLKQLSLTSNATREIADCSYGNGYCYFGAYSSKYDYTFGRMEGDAPVGANPLDKAVTKAFPLDIDNTYDTIGAYHTYLQARFKRNGINGKGGLGNGEHSATDAITAFTYIGLAGEPSCPNAFFNSENDTLNFCGGMASADIVFHEATHGLTHNSADLIYQNQSGALNESFSDIFAEAAENHYLGQNNWLLGSSSIDTNILGNGRSMKDPEAPLWNPLTRDYSNGNQPSHFYSRKFYFGEADNGGVHYNSGVLNHAAYLISEGGSLNGCVVSGLGIEKMEQIMYRALTKYLSKTSNFYDAYLAIRSAAWDLFPAEDFLSVEKALLAVQLNQPGRCSGIAASPTLCNLWIDECPNDPDLIREGACGCGVPEVDANGNGVPDCIDIDSLTRPANPVISKLATNKRKKLRTFYVALQEVRGARYIITLTPSRGRPVVKTLKSAFIQVRLKGRESWRISYKIRLNGKTSKSSRSMRLR